jgi:hypothetical protein
MNENYVVLIIVTVLCLSCSTDVTNEKLTIESLEKCVDRIDVSWRDVDFQEDTAIPYIIINEKNLDSIGFIDTKSQLYVDSILFKELRNVFSQKQFEEIIIFSSKKIYFIRNIDSNMFRKKKEGIAYCKKQCDSSLKQIQQNWFEFEGKESW